MNSEVGGIEGIGQLNIRTYGTGEFIATDMQKMSPS